MNTTAAPLLNSAQTAEYFGLSIRRLKALRQAETGPEWGQFEGSIRDDKRELDVWLNRRRQANQPAPDVGIINSPDE